MPREKPHPSCSNPQSGGITKVWIFSLRNEGFELHIRRPDPQILHRTSQFSKHMALKTTREYIQQLQGIENPLLKGSHIDSLNLKTSAKTPY